MTIGDEAPSRFNERTRYRCSQGLALAVDELRVLARSRRGRLAAAVYGLITLLPLALDLLIRNRYVVTWPLSAVEVAGLLQGMRLVDLVLVLALAHDTLTRGDHEGWQDSFASLPVGELTWLGGRLFGRTVFLLTVMAAPRLAGWGIASVWAARPLDPLPFVSVFLGSPCLALALILPLAVIAGCLGNSLVGAAVALFGGLFVAQMLVDRPALWLGMWDLAIPQLLLSGSQDLVRSLFRDGEMLFERSLVGEVYLPSWYEAAPPAGSDRGWPPLGGHWSELASAGLAVTIWLLFFLVVPSLLRLRRRAGRWRPHVRGLPTFGRWLSELVDQTRPTAPEGRGGRLLAMTSGLLLAAWLAWLAVAAAEAGGRERALAAPRAAGIVDGRWPTRLSPLERRLELEITGNGQLRGRELLRGVVDGRADRPVPFALAPGMQVLEVTDDRNRPLPWRRSEEHLWVWPPGLGALDVAIGFVGCPRWVSEWHGSRAWVDAKGLWWFSAPMLATRAGSGLRRYAVDLVGLSWAPEPLASLSGSGFAGGREPCWGTTSLELRLPSRLVPVPLPGDWQEGSSGGVTTASWQGRSWLLPPVTAGALRRARRGNVTAVVSSQGTDLESLLDTWQEAWGQTAAPSEAGAMTLHTVREPPPNVWASFSTLEPDLDGIAGLVSLGVNLELRPLPPSALAQVAGGVLSEDARLTRARLRMDELLPRVGGPRAAPVRWFLWRLVKSLERPTWLPGLDKRMRPGLELVGQEESSWRSVDLLEPRFSYDDQPYQSKLTRVVSATILILGREAVDDGLRRFAAGGGAPSLRDVWHALAGERETELDWFWREVILGRGLAAPVIEKVELRQAGAAWELEMTLANTGDAFVDVPLRLHGPGGSESFRVALAAGERKVVTRSFAQPPDQLLLDPDGDRVRRQIAPQPGSSWTRWGGVQ